MHNVKLGLFLFCILVNFLTVSSSAHPPIQHQGFTYDCKEGILQIKRDIDGIIFELPIGINPYPLVVYNHLGLVLNRGSNTLTLVDLNHHTVIKKCVVCDRPYPLSIYNGTAYITDYWGSDLTMINLETLEGTNSLPMTRGLSAMAIHQGNIYRVDRQTEQLFISEALTEQSIKKIPVGHCPRPMIIYDHFGYIVNWASQSVTVIDLQTNTLFATLSVGLAPLPLTIIEGFGYVFSNASKSLTVIDLKTAKIVGDGPYQSILGIKSFAQGMFTFDNQALPVYPTLETLREMEKVGTLDAFIPLLKPYHLKDPHLTLDASVWRGKSEDEILQFFRDIWEGRVEQAYDLNPQLFEIPRS